MIRDYSAEIDSYWPMIERAWNDYANKHPIIQCDLEKQQVGAYPAKEYIASLSERTRKKTQQLYDRTVHEGCMMLFIRDAENRVLQSYVFCPAGRRKKECPTKPSI